MNNEETTIFIDDGPSYDEYLPGPIQALVSWIILIISTLIGFFNAKSAE